MATLLVCLVTGCEQPDLVTKYALNVLTQTAEGTPLGGVEVKVRSTVLGVSDDIGLIQGAIKGTQGDAVQVEHKCPDGYVQPSEGQPLVLSRFESADKASVASLELRLACEKAVRRIAVLVEAPGADDFPVTLNGEEITRTNAFGIAHHVMGAAPGTEMKIALVVPSESTLISKNPPAVFEVGERDEIFLYQQSFQRPQPKKRRLKRRRIKRRRPRIQHIK